MNVRKTWFSYIIWSVSFLFTIFLCFCSLDRIIIINYNSISIEWILKAACLAVPIAVCFLLHYLFGRIPEIHLSEKAGLIIRLVSFVLLAAVFLWIRISYILSFTGEEELLLSPIYKDAMIQDRSGSDNIMVFTTESVYSRVISIILLFFGNKIESVLIFQLILQLITIIAIFIAGNELFHAFYGMIPAWLIACTPLFVESLVQITPIHMILFLWSLWMMFYSFIQKKDDRNYILTCLFSIFTGFITVIWGGFIIFLPMIAVWELESDLNSMKKRFLNVLILLSFSFLPSLILYFTTGIYDKRIVFNQFHWKDVFLFDPSGQTAAVFYFVYLVLLLFYFTTFWFSENDMGHLFLISVICNFAVTVFTGEFSDLSESLTLTAVLCAFLVPEMLFALFIKKCEKSQNVKSAEKVTAVHNGPCRKETPDRTVLKKDAVHSECASEVLDKIDNNKKSTPEPVQKIDKKAMIENVLPMPKKHVKKVLDYSYEPEPEEMHFDIDLNSSNSHYDV